MERQNSPTPHSLLPIAALLCLGLLLGLLLLEGMVRLAGDLILPPDLRYALRVQDFVRDWSTLFTNDAYLGSVMRPNMDVVLSLEGEYTYHVQTTDLGLGGYGYRDKPPSGPVLAAAVGDSFTWGLGVEAEQAWPALLAAVIGRPVINLGVPGHGSIQTARVVERTALPLHPRLILWGFVPNDLEDASIFSGRPPDMESTGAPPWWERWLAWLRPYSRLAMVSEFALGRGPFVWAQDYVDVNEGGIQMRFHPALAARQTDFTRGLVEAGWWLTRQAMLDAKRMAAEHGATLVVLLFPMRERAYRTLLHQHAPALDEAAFSADDLWARLLAFGQEAAIPVIDLSGPFTTAAQQGRQLYFRNDGHWNAAGHQVAAQAIHDGLRQMGLLDDDPVTARTN